jgi:hypothetical protein
MKNSSLPYCIFSKTREVIISYITENQFITPKNDFQKLIQSNKD